MKRFILTISLILIVTTIKAQDSLYNLTPVELNKHLLTQGQDTIRVNIYLALINEYIQTESAKKDSTFFYLAKAHDLSKKLNFVRGLKKSLYFLSGEYYSLMDYVNGIRVTTERIALAEATKDTSELLDALESKAGFYSLAKDYDNALIYSKTMSNISYEYSLSRQNQNQYDSLLQRNWNTGTHFYLNSLADIGDAFMNQNKLDSALFYFQKNYELAITKMYSLILPTTNMGEINYKIGNYEIALAYFKKAFILNLNAFGGSLEININLDLAKAFEKLGNKDSAFFYSKMAFRLSKGYGDLGSVLNTSEKLFQLYKADKNIDSAFYYQNIYISVKDSLFTQDKVRLLTKYSINEEMRQNEINEQKLQEQDQRRENIKLGLIAVFIPVFASISFLLGRKKRKHTKIISLMGLASLLMLFEFISLLLHPYIEVLTNHDTIFIYLILLIIAAILVPVHHKLEEWVKSKL